MGRPPAHRTGLAHRHAGPRAHLRDAPGTPPDGAEPAVRHRACRGAARPRHGVRVRRLRPVSGRAPAGGGGRAAHRRRPAERLRGSPGGGHGRARWRRRRRGRHACRSGHGPGRGAAGHAAGAAAGTGRATARDEAVPTGALTVGAARAGALLERQLTLARTRSHSAALQALGSSRFHAVADAVALLASEVPLGPAAGEAPEQVLPPLAAEVERQLEEAVAALPLVRAGHPYNADALVHGLAATPAADSPPASEQQDAPWHVVRRQLRLHRYAREVLAGTEGEPAPDVRLIAAGQALERHRDAAEAAAAAASAARTPRIAPATAYALGVLHADQRHEVEAARFAFYRIWERTAVNVP
ncbi:CHAD domain-containing protein [Streptomyces sp. GC420]|nr:CHAD domain-containing protein [Streptomyces sp. GC420]